MMCIALEIMNLINFVGLCRAVYLNLSLAINIVQGFIQDFWLGGEEIPTVHVWACMR